MDYDEIFNLPTYASAEDIGQFFKKIISDKGIFEEYPKVKVLEMVAELSDHQWHNYVLLDVGLMNELEEWLMSNFDFYEERITDLLLTIVGLLGLKNLYGALISFSGTAAANPTVRGMILNFQGEVKGNVSDPFRGMDRDM